MSAETPRQMLNFYLEREPLDTCASIVTEPTLFALYEIVPVPAPRMTRFDGFAIADWRAGKKALRDPVRKYIEYQDALQMAVLDSVQHDQFRLRTLFENLGIRFFMPQPASWSRKKQGVMAFAPHEVKPDNDNLAKAFFDTLFEQDSKAWDCRPQKRWADAHGPRIELWRLPPWE